MTVVTALNGKKFVFICGLHRSGTSLIFKCLREHPEISGFCHTGMPEDEGQHLQTVYPPAKHFGGPGRFGFKRASFLDEFSPLTSPANAAILFQEWSRYWDLRRPILLEKSPPNLVRTRFLQGLFPNSFFVVILRHPVAVSYATAKWSRTGTRSLLEHWLICHERFAADRPFLHRALTVKYEDFVTEPRLVLSRITSFLGVDSIQTCPEIEKGVNEKYFARWNPDRQRGNIARLEQRINNFGYSLTDLARVEPY